MISEQVWKGVSQPRLLPPGRTLRGPDTHKLPTTGQFLAKLSKDEQTAAEEVYVVKGLYKSLLRHPAIDKLGLVSHISSVDRADQTPGENFPQLFKGFGKWRWLSDTTTRRSKIICTLYTSSSSNSAHEVGWAGTSAYERSWSHCQSSRAHRVVCGHGHRTQRQWQSENMCGFDQSACRERHPLPAMDQILAQLAGAKLFSKLDANSGFWQIPSWQQTWWYSLQTGLSASHGKLSMFIYNSTIKLKPLAQHKAPLFQIQMYTLQALKKTPFFRTARG